MCIPLPKLFEWIARAAAVAAVVIWLVALSYVMSWVSGRPVQPDPELGRIHAYDQHGSTNYVSAQDLFLWHLGGVGAAALAIVAACFAGASKRWG